MKEKENVDEDEGEEQVEIVTPSNAIPSNVHESVDEAQGELATHGDCVESNEGIENISIRRRFKITRDILEQLGHIDDCPGCDASVRGYGRRERTRACRQRLIECLEKIEDGRSAPERERTRLTSRVDKGDAEEFESDGEAKGFDESVANIVTNHCKLPCNAERFRQILKKLPNERIEGGESGVCNDSKGHGVAVAEGYSPLRIIEC